MKKGNAITLHEVRMRLAKGAQIHSGNIPSQHQHFQRDCEPQIQDHARRAS
jgi:hypothetical protein